MIINYMLKAIENISLGRYVLPKLALENVRRRNIAFEQEIVALPFLTLVSRYLKYSSICE